MSWLRPWNGMRLLKRRTLKMEPWGKPTAEKWEEEKKPLQNGVPNCSSLSCDCFFFNKISTQKVENQYSFWSEGKSPDANNFLTWSFLPRLLSWSFAHIFLSHADIPDIGMCSTIPFVQTVHRLKSKLFLVPITDVSLCSIFNSDVGTCPGCPGDMNLG